jgi:predicted alpha/beta superfamily hydrolase
MIDSRLLGIGLALLWTLPLVAQENVKSPVALPQTEQFDLKSKTEQGYRIFVSAPQGGKEPEGGYPVIYLSDGNSNFTTMVAASQKLRMQGPIVVVGIGYPSESETYFQERRFNDLTSKAPDEYIKTIPFKVKVEKTGGNEDYLNFIEQEVKPLIEKKFKIDRNRQTFFGHSLGGLLVLHACFTRPESYQNFIAASPSIWWNDRAVLEEEKAFLKKYPSLKQPTRLLVTMGELEQTPGPKADKERAALLVKNRMVDNSRELSERLSQSTPKNFSVRFKLFEAEDHGSVVLSAAGWAMRLALTPPVAK